MGILGCTITESESSNIAFVSAPCGSMSMYVADIIHIWAKLLINTMYDMADIRRDLFHLFDDITYLNVSQYDKMTSSY